MSELTDRMPEINALVKIGRREEAKSRASRWADEVPQDYRAHFAAALAEVDFLSCAPVDVYFDIQRRKRFETCIARAKLFANTEQKAAIDSHVGGYMKTLKEMEKFHFAAYSQILARKDDDGERAEIWSYVKGTDAEKARLLAEIKRLQESINFVEKELESINYNLQKARRDYEYIENKGPKPGSFLTKKKREREHGYELARRKSTCTFLENTVNKNKAYLEDGKAKIAQYSTVLEGLNTRLSKFNSALDSVNQKWQTNENELADTAPWGREFFARLKNELRTLDFKRDQLEQEKERLARAEGKPENADKIRANISKLTQEISYLEKFLCKKSTAGGDASLKGGN